jgi:hypothetical protein
MKKQLLIPAILSFFLCGVSAVMADTTQLLGTTRLSFRENDLDSININSCPKPAYTSIQLRAKAGAVDIKRLYIRYGNGEIERPRIAENIRQGDRTRWINLNGNRRCIKQIAILGDTDNSSARRARVEFWGRY